MSFGNDTDFDGKFNPFSEISKKNDYLWGLKVIIFEKTETMNIFFFLLKRLMPGGILMGVLLSVLGVLDTFAGGPHLELTPSDVVDFGKFEARDVQTKVVYVKNTGDEPLEILKTFRGCSCTSLDYSHEPIAPGDSVAVTITLDARSRKPGLIRKSVRVTSNADNRVMAIFIRGEVARPFRADD